MTDKLPPAELGKRAAATRALEEVEPGMTLGLGTGSTARWFVDLLAERMVAEGFSVTGVPTSSVTAKQAENLDIPLTSLDKAGQLDLVIDGADEFDPAFNLIKGGGGALLQEKIVATASDRMIVITDPSKEVAHLGAFPLPVEIVRFGHETTTRLVLETLRAHSLGSAEHKLRGGNETPFVTDEGHYILDLPLGKIPDPAALNRELNQIAGVVETGLFCAIADTIIIGQPDGTARVIG
jgi:ribose 5-phosphate isomerase A